MDIAEVSALHAAIKQSVNFKILELENLLNADVVFFYGQIQPNVITYYRMLIQKLQGTEKSGRKNLAVFLNTPGGNAETVERLSDINRYFYDEVYFVVPDQAMSAGTVFCLSGDKIFMDYSSVLGPIDPQIYIEGKYVPIQGYLEKINECIEKATKGELLNVVEIALLQKVDFAFWQFCQQSSDFAKELVIKWLSNYMFKNQSDEKISVIENIADRLNNNEIWKSHGRFINIRTLQNLGLKIEDYTKNEKLFNAIHEYNNLLLNHIYFNNLTLGNFFNSRNYF